MDDMIVIHESTAGITHRVSNDGRTLSIQHAEGPAETSRIVYQDGELKIREHPQYGLDVFFAKDQDGEHEILLPTEAVEKIQAIARRAES